MSKASEYIRNAGKNSFHHTVVFELLKERDELLEALEMVTKQYQLVRDADSGFDGIPSKAIAKANAILAKAKGE